MDPRRSFFISEKKKKNKSKQNIHTLTDNHVHETCRNFDLGKIRFTSPFYPLSSAFFSFFILSLSFSKSLSLSFKLHLLIHLFIHSLVLSIFLQFFGLGFQHMKQIDCKIGVLQNWFSNFLCCIALRFAVVVFWDFFFRCSFEMITFFVLYIWNQRAPIQKDKKKLKAAIFSCVCILFVRTLSKQQQQQQHQLYMFLWFVYISTFYLKFGVLLSSNSNIFSFFFLCVYWK